VPPDDDSSSHGYVVLPEPTRSPWWSLGRRLLLGLAIIAFTVFLVYIDRGGYRDNNDPPKFHLNLIDAFYYTTVTLSTTGYGDIAPVSSGARLVNAFVITPLRIAFLVLLIGTTLEVLATQGRRLIRIARWRRHMSVPVVIVGYVT
jgi:voltage-gated potassium channel